MNTAVPAEWIRRGGLQKVERYSTAALDEHAVELAEAEGVVAAETRAVLDELARGGRRGRRRGARPGPPPRRRRRAALAGPGRRRARLGPPEIDEGDELVFEAGRHPVVEALGRAPFQPNDARLLARGERDQLVVLTGPNMAGKSTWMRQVALLTMLAQAGSFVPAPARASGWSTPSSPASARWTTWPAGARRSWSRWRRRPRCCAGRPTAAWSCWTRSGAARAPTTAWRSPGRWSSTWPPATVRPRAIVATHYHELAALGTAIPR